MSRSRTGVGRRDDVSLLWDEGGVGSGSRGCWALVNGLESFELLNLFACEVFPKTELKIVLVMIAPSLVAVDGTCPARLNDLGRRDRLLLSTGGSRVLGDSAKALQGNLLPRSGSRCCPLWRHD